MEENDKFIDKLIFGSFVIFVVTLICFIAWGHWQPVQLPLMTQHIPLDIELPVK